MKVLQLKLNNVRQVLQIDEKTVFVSPALVAPGNLLIFKDDRQQARHIDQLTATRPKISVLSIICPLLEHDSPT